MNVPNIKTKTKGLLKTSFEKVANIFCRRSKGTHTGNPKTVRSRLLGLPSYVSTLDLWSQTCSGEQDCRFDYPHASHYNTGYVQQK
jgi:hypothetical protein